MQTHSIENNKTESEKEMKRELNVINLLTKICLTEVQA